VSRQAVGGFQCRNTRPKQGVNAGISWGLKCRHISASLVPTKYEIFFRFGGFDFVAYFVPR
jgi:hypothetical protein